MSTNKDIIHASALAALPEIGSDGALPADIQVFPPGKGVKFTLQDYPGEEFEIDVDATVAAKANADLQNIYARASAGQGSKPFADKNHEDAEKTFTPLRYFWGGDDKIKGGVRVATDWTPFGADLVRAKAFSYFSGNFLFSKARKKFLGLLNENVGGLVNRPGFATQAAFAKAPSTNNQTNNMTDQELKDAIANGITAGLQPFETRIAAVEAKAKASETATAAHASADDKLTNAITTAVTAAIKPLETKITSFETAQKDELKARAKATVGKYIGRVGLAPQDTKAISFWENSFIADPATTEELLGKLPARAGAVRLTSAGGPQTGTTSTEPEDVFMAKAKAYGEANKITDETQAFIAFGRTPEGAALQDEFRNKVRSVASVK